MELWWNALPSFWKDLLTDQAMTSKKPTKEELHSIINIKNLKINHFIQDAEPISRLTNIEFLDMSDSKIDDLSPLYGLHNLKSLNVKNTAVSDLSALSNLKNLKDLNIENTDVKSLKALHELSNLSKVYADGSKINRDEVVGLKKRQRQVIIVYQTDELRLWWGNLDLAWREIFNNHLLCNSNPTAEQLQAIVDIEEIMVDPSNVVYSLEPLRQMAFLTKLIINNNQIQDLTPLNDKEFLEILSKFLGKITEQINFPSQLVPVVIVRMFSSSAATKKTSVSKTFCGNRISPMNIKRPRSFSGKCEKNPLHWLLFWTSTVLPPVL